MDARQHIGTGPAAGRALWRAALAGSGLCVALALSYLARDALAGGHHWNQADWLIHGLAGPVRRGPFGSLMLGLSDALGLSPVALVVALQAGLTLLLAGLVWWAVLRLRAPLHAVLLLCPGMFFVFWGADTSTGMRKELIAWAAIALMLPLPALRPGVWRLGLLWASAGLFVLGCFGHEANVLLGPLWAAVLWALGGAGRPAASLPPLALAAVGAGVALLYAWAHPSVPDAGALCAELLARGVPPGFCHGAIAWLARDMAENAAIVRAEAATAGRLGQFLLGYALALAPMIWLSLRHDRPGLLLAALALLALPLLPLYAVALDWGRWMALHLTGFGLLLLALSLGGRVRPQPGGTAAVAGFSALGLVWKMDPLGGVAPDGLLRMLARIAGSLG